MVDGSTIVAKVIPTAMHTFAYEKIALLYQSYMTVNHGLFRCITIVVPYANDFGSCQANVCLSAHIIGFTVPVAPNFFQRTSQ